MEKTKDKKKLTYCGNCHHMTYSIRKNRAYWVCEKCGNNKTLSDVFQFEAKGKFKKEDENNSQGNIFNSDTPS